MTRIYRHTITDAPEASRPLLEGIVPFSPTGKLLNMHAQMAHSPAVLAAYASIRQATATYGTLDPRVRSALMLATAQTRWRVRQALGEGADPALIRAVRRHGNFAENAAIFVVSLALLEMLGAARVFVAALAALFVLGRIFHAIGLSQANTVNVWRVSGVFATVLAGVILGVRLVLLGAARLG